MLALWVGFFALVFLLLALDLGVFNRKDHEIGIREAFGWTIFWISLALVFNAVLYFFYKHHWMGLGLDPRYPSDGPQAAMLFFTAYVVEKSLSLDNIFVMALIFSYFAIPLKYQHRVLFWGIVGALVLRGVMIGAGVVLIQKFSWMIYVFGGILVVTAIKMATSGDEEVEPEKNPLLRLVRRWFPVVTRFEGHKFFVRENGRLAATPLLLALVVVESTDVVFAVDSIPAVIAVTHDPFLVFTSNVFAILGLRSLYFALAAVMNKFRFLKASLVFVLGFIGVKMLLSHHLHISTAISMAVIGAALTIGIVVSVIASYLDEAPKRTEEGARIPLGDRLSEKTLRKIWIALSGGTLILLGLAMLVLPGPGLITLAGGFAVLATEFTWAAVVTRHIRRHAEALAEKAKSAVR